MDLKAIAKRFAEGLTYVDAHTSIVSHPRGIATQPPYLPGVPTMHERDVASEFMNWWIEKYPADINPSNAHQLEVPYPNLARASCDIVFSSDGVWTPEPEWAVEIKRIQLLTFLYNALEGGWNIKKQSNPFNTCNNYVFVKKHNGQYKMYEDDEYLTQFMKNNLSLES